MAGSLGWLVFEMNRAPGFEESAMPQRTVAVRKAVLPAPRTTGADALAVAEKPASASPEIQPLNAPDAIPGEALLTFRTAEALAGPDALLLSH